MEKYNDRKTKKEISYIKKACEYSDKIFADLIDNFGYFRTEQDVADFISKETKKYGLVESFPSIVASGENGAYPHHVPTKKKLNKGFCVIDFGVKYNGYCSDMTRMIFLGMPSRKEIERYNLVLNVQEDCLTKTKEGANAYKIYSYAKKILGKRFVHGLGHQIGKEVHDIIERAINKKGHFALQKGMVVTVEPGIYVKNFYGIRIEDTVVVNDKKTEPTILTKTPKNLLILE